MSKLHTATQILADEQIIERIINGENDLYERLIRKYNDRLFRILQLIYFSKKWRLFVTLPFFAYSIQV